MNEIEVNRLSDIDRLNYEAHYVQCMEAYNLCLAGNNNRFSLNEPNRENYWLNRATDVLEALEVMRHLQQRF
jgi:hypothetical protein